MTTAQRNEKRHASDAVTDLIAALSARNENGHASDIVTQRAAERATRVAVHGEEAVAAAETRAAAIGKYSDARRPATPAERARLHRARKRGLLGPAEPASPKVPDAFGGGSWDAYRKLWKRHHRREYLKGLLDKAKAGNAAAAAELQEHMEACRAGRLLVKYRAFLNDWGRAPDNLRRGLVAYTNIVDDLHEMLGQINELMRARGI